MSLMTICLKDVVYTPLRE